MQPINNDIGLTSWWPRAQYVASKLLDTKKGNPDKEWWSRVIRRVPFGSSTDKYDGWFVRDFLGFDNMVTLAEMPKGFATAPLTILSGEKARIVQDQKYFTQYMKQQLVFLMSRRRGPFLLVALPELMWKLEKASPPL